MSRLLLALLRIYKVALSPYLGSRCRFWPTCSDYARDAVLTHGPARGTWMAACRLCRCHPFAKGGYDPVPDSRSPNGDASGNATGDANDAASAAAPQGSNRHPSRHPAVTVRLPRP